jgi:hypothetical protein
MLCGGDISAASSPDADHNAHTVSSHTSMFDRLPLDSSNGFTLPKLEVKLDRVLHSPDISAFSALIMLAN